MTIYVLEILILIKNIFVDTHVTCPHAYVILTGFENTAENSIAKICINLKITRASICYHIQYPLTIQNNAL